MLALVAMRFLAPACLALIVSLPGDQARAVQVKATRQQRALAHRHQPGGRPAPARQPPRRVLRHRIRDRHYPARPGTSPAGREDQRHWSKIRSGQELVEGLVTAEPVCPGVFRDVLATFGVV